MSTIECVDKLSFFEPGVGIFEVNSSEYLGFTSGKDIIVKNISDKCAEDLTLTGHHSNITYLCINSFEQEICLASGGSHYLILWDMKEIVACSVEGKVTRGKVVAKLDNRPPKTLHLSKQNLKVCVTNSNGVFVFHTKTRALEWSRDDTRYTRAAFLDEGMLISILEDCKLELWNVEEDVILWTSNLFQSRITNLEVGFNGTLVLGFANHVVKCFSLKSSDAEELGKIFEVDLDMEMFRQKDSNSVGEIATNSQIIAMYIADFEERKIFCSTGQAIFIIDYLSHEVEVLPFLNFELELMSNLKFCQKHDGSMFCVVASLLLFPPETKILEIKLSSSTKSTQRLSVLPKTPVLQNSILKKSLLPSKTPKKLTKVKDNAVTFHSKIKSSGYNVKPQNRKMFKPVMSFKAEKITPKPSAAIIPKPTQDLSDWSSTCEISGYVPVCDLPSNINHMSVSPCNRYVACSFQNHSSVILNRRTKKHIASLSGHDGAVTRNFWTHDSSFLLTGSADCSAKVWSKTQPEKAVLNMEFLHGNFGKNSEKFTKEISHSQFYYMDKFIVLSFGNCFGLYAYYIGDAPKSDIKRYLNENKYKLVKLFSISDTQSISCMTAPSNIYSYICLACGSDKTVHVYDMNVGGEILKIDSIHTRPACQVVQNTGSSFSQPLTYDIFATTAPTDGVKLWDLRSTKCVAKFTAHPNSTHCPFDITPCGKYLATAGDNKSLYIYDIRKICLVQATVQLKDKVSALCFDKDGSEMFAGLRNGDVATVSVSQ